jgi:hypothetical protein
MYPKRRSCIKRGFRVSNDFRRQERRAMGAWTNVLKIRLDESRILSLLAITRGTYTQTSQYHCIIKHYHCPDEWQRIIPAYQGAIGQYESICKGRSFCSEPEA